MEKTIYFRVTGRVQGVFFRASTRDRAIAAGITGWVRNLQDGGVEGNATASAMVLEDFLGWLRQGPQLAEVEALEIREIETQYFSDFDIRRMA